MRKVVIGILLALFVGCVVLAGVGVFFGVPLVRKLAEAGRGNVVEVMRDSLYQSSYEAIAAAGNEPGSVRIQDRDLTVNNTSVAGEAGWETGTSGTVVYGFDVWFTPDGVHIGVADEAMYSGVPIVVDGRLELAAIEAIEMPSFMSLMSSDDFESMMEGGLNDAFAAHGLIPTDLTLSTGQMIVSVAPVDNPAATGETAGSPMALAARSRLAGPVTEALEGLDEMLVAPYDR